MTSLICCSSRASLKGGINESPFSIQVFRVASVTLLLFTENVPRLEIPFKPGPIFLSSVSAKWHMEHFWVNTSLPLLAEPDDLLADVFLGVVFAVGSCARTAIAMPNTANPRTR